MFINKAHNIKIYFVKCLRCHMAFKYEERRNRRRHLNMGIIH